MSEFKRSMAIASASAVTAIGSMFAQSELEEKYLQQKITCDQTYQGEQLKDCKIELGSNPSQIPEIIGFAALLGFAVGSMGVLASRSTEK